MSIDSETLNYVWGVVSVPLLYVGKLIWSNHKSLSQLREEIAKDYPTWKELHQEIGECSDQKDKILMNQKEDLDYIRTRIDRILDRELDKNG